MSVRGWIDRFVGPYALLILREATGRADPLPHITPTAAAALEPGTWLAFWSLTAGVGTSTLAALVAHRSTAARSPALLVDLDRRAPCLALRARVEAAGIGDALLRPGHEAELVSRWDRTPLLPGTPGIGPALDGGLAAAAVERAAAGRAAVLDLGSGAEALDPRLLARCGRLIVCVGTRVAQLQAAFCAVPLLASLEIQTAVAVIGASDEDARSVAARLPWQLAGCIPADDHLAADDFAARAPTVHAVDALIRAIGA